MNVAEVSSPQVDIPAAVAGLPTEGGVEQIQSALFRIRRRTRRNLPLTVVGLKEVVARVVPRDTYIEGADGARNRVIPRQCAGERRRIRCLVPLQVPVGAVVVWRGTRRTDRETAVAGGRRQRAVSAEDGL